MKKIFSTLLALALVLTGTAFADATPTDVATKTTLPAKQSAPDPEPAEVTPLQGVVTELAEDGSYFLISDESHGPVQVNTGDETVLEGTEALALGDYVFVNYSGAMTFSIPAQVFADRVTAHSLTGTVTEVLDGGFLMETETQGVVEVRADASSLQVFGEGLNVTVFYDGVITASLPGQINAALIRVFTLSGTVTRMDGQSFLILGDDGAEYEVLLAEETLVWSAIAAGEHMSVSYDGKLTRSIPAQLTAQEVYLSAPEAVETTVD